MEVVGKVVNRDREMRFKCGWSAGCKVIGKEASNVGVVCE